MSGEGLQQKFEAFVQKGGAFVLAVTNPWEYGRFKTARGTHVVYTNAKGRFRYSDKYAEEAHHAFMHGKQWVAGDKVKRRGVKALKVDIMQRDGDCCFYCAQPFTIDNPSTIEHMLALVSGGNHALANLVLAHKPCNHEAGDLSIAEKVALRDRKMNRL